MHSWLNKSLKKKLENHIPALKLILGTFGVFFTYIFSQILLIKPNGVYVGQPNSWSDWVVHISITNIFASKPISEWFLYHPFFAYGKLTYGFLVHLITALFIRLGFSLSDAFFIVSILLLFFFLTGLYFLYFTLSTSRKESLLGVFIFFTSSGMGIFRFLQSLEMTDILRPVQDYSRFVEYQWLAGNIPAAILIPQRAFFIGVTIGVWVLNLLLWGLDKSKKNSKTVFAKLSSKLGFVTNSEQKKILLSAGILAGILPIAHMHSFIVVSIVTGIICLFNWAKFRLLLPYFVLPAAVISTTLYFSFINGGIEIPDFMRLSVGWTVPKTGAIYQDIFAWIKMWLQLWGTFLPSSLFAFFLFKNKLSVKKHISTFFGFFAVFFLANIIIFQPTAWDNTKLFAWVYLGLSILVAKLVIHLWQKTLIQKIASIILVITLSTTGFVELLRIVNFIPNTHMLSSSSEVLLAQKIAKNTATDAVFLTSTTHNHPIPLWANRPIYLGYLGWVRNFGFDHTVREKQLLAVYSGSAQAHKIITENKISYIFVGPKEVATLTINTQYLQQFPIAFQNEDTTVYDTRQLWQ